MRVSYHGFSLIRKLWSRIISLRTFSSSRALKWMMTLVFESLHPLFAGACVAASIRPAPHPIRPLLSYRSPFILGARYQVYSSWKLPVWLELPPNHLTTRADTSRRNDAFFERVKGPPAEYSAAREGRSFVFIQKGVCSHKWNVIIDITD